jgi:uncharacterized protein YdaU (DUF1376 family)
MKKGDVWMPLYIGDYLRDTGRLTTTHHGAYMLLLMDYWINGPPPDDDEALAAITKSTPFVWKKMRANLQIFFKIHNGFWHHKRINEEKEKTAQTIEKYKERSKKGNDAKRLKGLLEGSLEGEQKDSLEVPPSPSPSPTPLKTKAKSKTSDISVTLPNWLTPEIWKSWVEHRIGIKKPMTQAAADLSIKALEKLKQEGNDPEQVIQQSIIGGYTGLFQVRNNQQHAKSTQSYSDQNRDFAERLTGRKGGNDGYTIDAE